MKRPGVMVVIAMTAASMAMTCGEQKAMREALDPSAFLPDALDSAGIVRSSEVTTYEGESLYEYINGGAELYHSYDFVAVATASYSRGDVEVTVDIYRFADADKAFGLFSMLRPPDPGSIVLGVEGFASEASLDFVKGRHVVRTVGYDESSATSFAIGALAEAVADLIPGTVKRPERFSLLPDDHALAATARIYAESFLGRRFLTDVYSQDYLLNGDSLTLFLTEDRPGDKHHLLLEWAGQNRSTIRIAEGLPYDEGRVFCFVDGYYGKIVVGLKDNLLLGMVNYDDSEQHRRFLTSWLTSLAQKRQRARA